MRYKVGDKIILHRQRTESNWFDQCPGKAYTVKSVNPFDDSYGVRESIYCIYEDEIATFKLYYDACRIR